MTKTFHSENRKNLYSSIEQGTLVLSFAGQAPNMSADAYYSFYTNRNFLYLTGLEGAPTEKFVLLTAVEDTVDEQLFILPCDPHAMRWEGRRLSSDEVTEITGIAKTSLIDTFYDAFHRLASTGKFHTVALDLWKHKQSNADDDAHTFAKYIQATYPHINVTSYSRQLCKQRAIKAPCEIDAMRKAIDITKEGIIAMMKGSKSDMYEYEYKALFDYELTKRGVMQPAFTSIISSGNNNFCIHYNEYGGKTKDGDMILNDVGAKWDNECVDVSRGWPCNGVFTEKQKALYMCAYLTSEWMFSVIKPGIVMSEIDKMCHKHCFEHLKKLGLLDDFKDIGKYMWHGGAHHIGYDTHDRVVVENEIKEGMVFCVDVGIYVEEWGIGFRLEDNCLVTKDGCENLSGGIPRTIEEIEAVMKK